MTISHKPNSGTLVTSPVRDQAALFGAAMNACDLGLTSISVHQIENASEGERVGSGPLRRFPVPHWPTAFLLDNRIPTRSEEGGSQ
jgi:hypothetical protein